MKRSIITTLSLLLLAACNPTHEEVVTSYDNGNPELVYVVKGKNEHRHLVGEKMYYYDGQLRLEKHYQGEAETPTGTWNYYYPNGNIFAKANFDKSHPQGDKWEFYKADKQPFHQGATDSMAVLEFSSKEIPATVSYYKGDTAWLYKFFENYALQAEGKLVNQRFEGRWNYYYPDGTPQVEANFIGGLENGAYKCYRENGIPYYLGYYINGKKANNWEFYDTEGNLSGTKNFDE